MNIQDVKRMIQVGRDFEEKEANNPPGTVTWDFSEGASDQAQKQYRTMSKPSVGGLVFGHGKKTGKVWRKGQRATPEMIHKAKKIMRRKKDEEGVAEQWEKNKVSSPWRSRYPWRSPGLRRSYRTTPVTKKKPKDANSGRLIVKTKKKDEEGAYYHKVSEGSRWKRELGVSGSTGKQYWPNPYSGTIGRTIHKKRSRHANLMATARLRRNDAVNDVKRGVSSGVNKGAAFAHYLKARKSRPKSKLPERFAEGSRWKRELGISGNKVGKVRTGPGSKSKVLSNRVYVLHHRRSMGRAGGAHDRHLKDAGSHRKLAGAFNKSGRYNKLLKGRARDAVAQARKARQESFPAFAEGSRWKKELGVKGKRWSKGAVALLKSQKYDKHSNDVAIAGIYRKIAGGGGPTKSPTAISRAPSRARKHLQVARKARQDRPKLP